METVHFETTLQLKREAEQAARAQQHQEQFVAEKTREATAAQRAVARAKETAEVLKKLKDAPQNLESTPSLPKNSNKYRSFSL